MDNLHEQIKEKLSAIKNLDESQILQNKRNFVFITSLSNDLKVVVKLFKKPNYINRIVYGYFRSSKAKRSFNYAKKLTELDLGTPKPISYFEQKSILGLSDSYYCCEFVQYDFTFRYLTTNDQVDDFDNIIREFTRFTFNLHEKGVYFLDHSPGNTLIRKPKGPDKGYEFFLVDLNRMLFKDLSLNDRIKNFSRLTKRKDIIKIMSDEYALLIEEDFELIYDMMLLEVQKFQDKFFRKKRLKKKLKFWK